MWNTCLQYLENQLDEHEIATWFSPLKVVEEEGILTLFAPNVFVKNRITSEYLDHIKEAISASTEQEKVRIRVVSGQPTPAKADNAAPAKKRRPTTTVDVIKNAVDVFDSDPILAHHTFESFISGKSNQLSLAACQAAVETPGSAYNPIYIYGNTGLGKTHLLHAYANEFLRVNPTAKVLYHKSSKIVRQIVDAVRHQQIHELKNYYQSADAWLIDDIQFLQHKDRTQEEFFEAFNHLFEGNQQIILTCDQLPNNLDGLEDRLKSRFNWGVTMEIEAPDVELRTAVLMDKSDNYGVFLPEEVAFFIARRMRTNIRELEGALKDMILTHNFSGRPITIELAEETLNKRFSEQRILTMSSIQETVTAYFRLKSGDLVSNSRVRSIARPRQLAMTLCKELTHRSLPEIGKAFGGRDHTTVLHAIKKVQELRDSDDQIRKDYTCLMQSLSKQDE